MTETVEQLKARAERAVKLAAEIQSLQNATAGLITARMKLENSRNEAYLADLLLQEVVRDGLAAVIRNKEASLALSLSSQIPLRPQENNLAGP